MNEISTNNKRIAKNTLMLYVRMIVTMSVSLYTSRIVLNALGIEDYGIYSVVAGVVVLLGFLNGAMTGATQRFLNIGLGKNDTERLKGIFSSSILIHLCVSVIIIILAETIGLWFLKNHMNIGPTRMDAANWVYHFSVLTFAVGVISVPYHATIIAHEKMSMFAYTSILEASLKLLVAYCIFISPFDRLVFYAFLILLVKILLRFIYGLYCKRYFIECSFNLQNIDKSTIRQMTSFSTWTMIGNLGYLLHTHGIAIIINLFFGATVNAAQGISNQVNSVVRSFADNFITALKPQIVKSYAANELDNMHLLISRGCRLSFSLLLMLVLPIIIETPFILKLWLKTIPDYTIIFVRLVLFITLADSFSNILATAKGATGDIKTYQFLLTTIGFCHLPLTWLFYYWGYQPYSAMYIYLFIVIILQLVRSFMACRSISYPVVSFYKEVMGRCAFVGIFSVILPVFLFRMMNNGLLTMSLVILSSIISVSIFTFFIGMHRIERKMIIKQATKMIRSNS